MCVLLPLSLHIGEHYTATEAANELHKKGRVCVYKVLQNDTKRMDFPRTRAISVQIGIRRGHYKTHYKAIV